MMDKKMSRGPTKFLVILIAILGPLALTRIGLSMDRVLVIMGICLFSAVIHCYRIDKRDDYLEDILGLTMSEGRDYRYDYLRVLAVIMVITTHILQVDISYGLVESDGARLISTIVYMLCLVCNLLYVMLSGALLIVYREESLLEFYTKRVTKIVIPMVVYFVFYLWQNAKLEVIDIDTIKMVTTRLLQGDTSEAPHFWLLYSLISVYIAIPLFRYMFRNMPYRVLSSIVFMSLVLMSVNTFCAIDSPIDSFIYGWEAVAIIGYWVTRDETRKYYRHLMCVAVVAFAIMVWLIVIGANYQNLCCNTSPIMTLIGAGIFAFVFSHKSFRKGGRILSVLSKYSYSVILIHWWTLHWVSKGILHIEVMDYQGVGLLLSFAVTLLVSLLAAIMIDNFMIVAIEKIIMWMIEGARYIANKNYRRRITS